MDIFSKEIIIPITAAILGIAVPLLIGVIQRIDDKYESTRLIQLFMNERSTKHFLGLLAITIFLLFYQLVAPPNYFDFGVLTKYIDYSAIILATIFCVLLTFSIFMIFRLIYIYNVPEKLQKHLIKRNDIPRNTERHGSNFLLPCSNRTTWMYCAIVFKNCIIGPCLYVKEDNGR